MESQPARPRPRPIVMAAVIAIVALVVGVAYLATSTTVQPTILQGGAGSNSSSPCGNPFPAEVQRGDWSGSGGAGRQIVTFFLPSNAVGTVCVSYQAPASAQSLLASPNSTVLSGSVLSPNVTYSGGGYIVNSENPADGVTITTTLQYSSNNASGGTMSVVAMYTIESSAAKGIFAFSYPGECPPWIPIAIGYSANAAQKAINSAYGIFLDPSGCINYASPEGIQFGGNQVVGIGGSMQVGYVAAEKAGI